VIVKPNKTSFFIRKDEVYHSPRGEYVIEGDASSASYFLALGAICGGPITVVGCGTTSIQGDKHFGTILEKMGAHVQWGENNITVSSPQKGCRLKGIDVDCSDIPDAAMTLAVVALFAKGTTTLRNIGSWRLKECDRLKAMVTELNKLQQRHNIGKNHIPCDENEDNDEKIAEKIAVEGFDCLTIHPPPLGSDGFPLMTTRVSINTYQDHRMAMCFSLIACTKVRVTIQDPDCTKKTFPSFFKELNRITTHTNIEPSTHDLT